MGENVQLRYIKNRINKLYLGRGCTLIPIEYWCEYDDCECELKLDYSCNERFAILIDDVALPIVVFVAKATDGFSIGHGMYFGESNPDYNHVYLLGGDGRLTRKVENAKVYWVNVPIGARVPSSVFIQDKPKGYMILGMKLVWEAQQRLDERYPLPRKAISKKERELTYQKFNGHCAYCGKPITLKEMQVDHIKSHMTNGGKDDLENYYPSCPVCNRVKSDYTLEQFRNQIKRCGEIHRNRKKPIMADSDKIALSYGIDKEDKPITFYFEKVEEK